MDTNTITATQYNRNQHYDSTTTADYPFTVTMLISQPCLLFYWPSMQQFMNDNPSCEQTHQCNTWINQGFNQYSTLTFVKSIVCTKSLDQLFLFFHDSSARQPHLLGLYRSKKDNSSYMHRQCLFSITRHCTYM